MTTITPRARTSRARLIATAATAILVTTGAASSLAYQQDNPVQLVLIEFADASPLLDGNVVKVNGVAVGNVTTMNVVDGKARIGVEMGPAAPPVHQDATAAIRADSILGERFIDVSPGSLSTAKLAMNAVIPADRTSSDVDLQDLFDSLDNPTSMSLAAMVATLGEGLEGNGENVDAAIRALAPAMEQTDQLVSVLRKQNDTLSSLMDTMAPVAAALAVEDGQRLDGLVESTRAVLATTSIDRQALEATLAELAPTLTSGRGTLSQLTATADATTPTLRSMRPTTDRLTEISAELEAFADAAEPALGSLDSVLEEGTRMLAQARPVAEQLRLLGPDMTSGARSLTPLVAELAGNVTNVMEFFKRWALTTNGRDGLGHYFRANIIAGHPEQVTGITPFGGGLGVGGEEERQRSNPGGVPNPPESEGELPEFPVPDPGLGSGLLAPGTPADGGATGMTQEQERSALDFMLGGG